MPDIDDTRRRTQQQDVRRRVLEVLRTRCRAAMLSELVRATGLDELQVLDALYALEHDGLVTPSVWRINDLDGGDA
jgi:predicted transcriptional regulator